MFISDTKEIGNAFSFNVEFHGSMNFPFFLKYIKGLKKVTKYICFETMFVLLSSLSLWEKKTLEFIDTRFIPT